MLGVAGGDEMGLGDVAGAGRGGGATGGRHSLDYDLIDLFDRPGCPVCRLGLSGVYRWLDSFAYEGVNDYELRAALRASRGFCNAHAWQLIGEVHDLLGVAIVYRDVVHTSLPALAEAVPSPGALEPQGVCRACTALEDTCGRYLDIFQESLPDREFRRAYEGGPAALCRDHTQGLLERLPSRKEAGVAAELVAGCWQAALRPAEPGANDTARPRRYRGIAGATSTMSATGFATPEPSILKDPAVASLALLVGRPRTGTLASGLRTLAEAAVPAAQDGAAPDWERVCQSGVCPICRLTLAEETSRLSGAGALPRSEAEVLALCNAHAWRLAELGQAAAFRPACEAALSGLAAALVDPAALARQTTDPFARGAHSHRSRAGAAQHLADRLEPVADCPWCVQRAATEAWSLDRLLDGVQGRPAVGDALGRSGGLCRLHFVRALERTGGGGSTAAARLAQVQHARWTALRDDLLEYIRKADYRFHEEPKGDEQHSPWRATEQGAGAKGIRP
jgi:hypothetical protein